MSIWRPTNPYLLKPIDNFYNKKRLNVKFEFQSRNKIICKKEENLSNEKKASKVLLRSYTLYTKETLLGGTLKAFCSKTSILLRDVA